MNSHDHYEFTDRGEPRKIAQRRRRESIVVWVVALIIVAVLVWLLYSWGAKFPEFESIFFRQEWYT